MLPTIQWRAIYMRHPPRPGRVSLAHPPTAQKIARAWKKVCVGFSIPTPKIKNTPPPWASQLNEAAGRSLDLHSLGALLFYQATSTAAAPGSNQANSWARVPGQQQPGPRLP